MSDTSDVDPTLSNVTLTKEASSFIGRWGICRRGRLGKITGKKELPWGLSWVGDGLDGTPWASTRPIMLQDKDANILNVLLSTEDDVLAAEPDDVILNSEDDTTTSSEGDR